MASTRQNHRADAFARLFEAVHEGVYIGLLTENGAPGRTLAANPHFKRIYGYPVDIAEDSMDPFAEDRFADPTARAALVEQLTGDGEVADYLLRMRRLDGSTVWVELTARAEVDRHTPRTLRVETLVRDVSERKKLDEQARELYQQLLHAEKMAALGQTISGVAHELNNPLATILGWAERLAGKTLDETARRGVDVIRSESERASRIVRTLLTFARKRQSTRRMVALNEVVRETLTLRSYDQRARNISVVTELAADLPQIFADGHQIQQVLLNLVINAEQAMLSAHGRGSLTVGTRHEADRNSVVLEVTDDGPGVPVDVENKIFDPFFTTKEAGQGTGLGLSVAHAIVQEHGGRIRVAPRAPMPDGRPRRGASFVVELPIAAVKPVAGGET